MRKNRSVNLITLLFVAAAAMLISLAALLIVNLSGAMDTLMKRAETPHFLQMHSGPIDTARLERFAESSQEVAEYQILEFLNIDSSQISIDGSSLASSVQDNGFIVQSGLFDFLLDLDNRIIEVLPGEVYLPLCYMKDGQAEIGDTLTSHGIPFTVTGFLRDSQMNANLSSSKRLLISREDYARIREFGEVEYLIEFRLQDLSQISAFEAAYEARELESNGPTLTYPLFKMINALSDGLMIAVIILVSVLITAIAFMCIRFTLLAKIEEDYTEIGIMKAIGLQVSDIKRIYLLKYAVISAAGCMLGIVLSFLFRDALLTNIRLFMGESENSALAGLFGLAGVLLVFCIIMLYVNRLLRAFRDISAVEAIRFGVSRRSSCGHRRLRLSSSRILHTNVFLGVKDVLSRKSLYITMLMVLILASFIIIFPQNLYTTISLEDFVTYMGVGNYDLRFDIQQTDQIQKKAGSIAEALEADDRIEKYALFITRSYTNISEAGVRGHIKIELGDHDAFPIAYSKGRPARSPEEITLSEINADELEKEIGDTLTLITGDQRRTMNVVGIYSDITNGGKTAKAGFSDDSEDIMWSVICAELKEPSSLPSVKHEYAAAFGFAKVSGVQEFVDQTFGSTVNSIRQASYASIASALVISVLVTILFMKMLIAKDRYSIAVMKSFGFTSSDIAQQYISRSVFVLIISVILGTLLANTLGEVMAGRLIASFGASSFTFRIDPLRAYVLSPLAMTAAVFTSTLLSSSRAGDITIIDHIKE